MERCAQKLEQLPDNSPDEPIKALEAEFERLQGDAEQAKAEYKHAYVMHARSLTLGPSNAPSARPGWLSSPGMSEARSRALWANDGADFLPPRGRENNGASDPRGRRSE
jgi:hypothetical protein